MKVVSLQSGSNGNCIYVESGGVGLVIDAGISGKQAEFRLLDHQRKIRNAAGVLISHDHADHARSAGIFHRKFGLDLYATHKTLAACERHRIGKLRGTCHFDAGCRLQFGPMSVETVPTPHDAVDGVSFVIDDGTHRLGILTDLGHVFDGLEQVIGSLDAVLIESNYDPHRLETGPYPLHLQRRIAGPGGHLSNREAAELLDRAGGRLKWACLAHLSEQNNDPELALRTHLDVLGARLPLYVADRYAAVGPLTL